MRKILNFSWPHSLQLVISIFLVALVEPPCFAASFDCVKASKRIEKLICSNSALSNLDEKLSVVYSRSISVSTDQAELLNSQRRWLRDNRNRCADIACAMDAYTKRLTYLEKISGEYAEIPDSKFISTLCGKLADDTTRRQILAERDSVGDINNDGRLEIAKHCWGGTMNSPCTEYMSQQGEKISLQQMNYDRLDFVLGEQSFRYAGRTFSLLTSDYELTKPISLIYVTPSNEEYALCKFSIDVSSVPSALENDVDGVCKAASEGAKQIQKGIISGNESFDVGNAQFDEDLRLRLSVNDSGTVDIDNDGIQEKVVELQYSDTGGRGCEFNYFDLLDESGANISISEKRSNLLAMQGIPESDFYIRGCGQVSNRIFRYQNRTYYESNVTQSEGARSISFMNGNQTKVVCNFIRLIKVDGFKQIGSDSMYFIE